MQQPQRQLHIIVQIYFHFWFFFLRHFRSCWSYLLAAYHMSSYLGSLPLHCHVLSSCVIIVLIVVWCCSRGRKRFNRLFLLKSSFKDTCYHALYVVVPVGTPISSCKSKLLRFSDTWLWSHGICSASYNACTSCPRYCVIFLDLRFHSVI